MNLKEFGEKLPKIVALYEEHCGNRENPRTLGQVFFHTVEGILEILETRGGESFRVGSRWDGHSKIRISDEVGGIKVSFNPNFDPKDKKGQRHKEALEQGKKFEEAVKRILEGE